MQKFLPYPDFQQSVECLDYKRLGKQRVEAFQILNILTGQTKKKGWVNHPAVLMWKGFENALKDYYNKCVDEWIKRGYNNTMVKYTISGQIIYPPWFGNTAFHSSHRSNLLRKDAEYYSKFQWSEPDNLEYVWVK